MGELEAIREELNTLRRQNNALEDALHEATKMCEKLNKEIIELKNEQKRRL